MNSTAYSKTNKELGDVGSAVLDFKAGSLGLAALTGHGFGGCRDGFGKKSLLLILMIFTCAVLMITSRIIGSFLLPLYFCTGYYDFLYDYQYCSDLEAFSMS